MIRTWSYDCGLNECMLASFVECIMLLRHNDQKDIITHPAFLLLCVSREERIHLTAASLLHAVFSGAIVSNAEC